MRYKKLFLILTVLVFSPICFTSSANASETNTSTSLSLEPKVIEAPYLGLDNVSALVVVKLKIHNVHELKEFSFKFTYNTSILEPCPPHDSFGMIDPSFYLTAGGWTGSSLMGQLGETFSGSGTMFTYGFRVLNPGSTPLNLTDSKLTNSSGFTIPHTVSGCTVEVLSFEDCVDGEYVELMEQYDSLNSSYSLLQTDYHSLNSTYYNLLLNYTRLQEDYDSLNASYSFLQTDYASLTSTYTELEQEHQSIISELNTIRTLMYILTATTILFIATTVYYRRKRSPLVWR